MDLSGGSEDRAALYLAASTAPSMSADKLSLLLDRFGSLQAALNAPQRQLRSVPGVMPHVARALVTHVAHNATAALQTVRQAQGAGLQVVCWEDAAYPRPLRDDPHGSAHVLFVQGRLPAQLMYDSFRVRSCAIVGRRQATLPAANFARDVARSVARHGVVVVSGLARGIDAAAHQGAIEAQQRSAPGGAPITPSRFRWSDGLASSPLPAPTVAVLGGGHGRIYPRSHASLARGILDTGGAILSQWAPDVSPRKHHFPQRNRVVSGLSRVVAVIEAGLKSGTNSTVDHALEQGRTVMAVPAAPWTSDSQGCVQYLLQGAKRFLDETELLAAFEDLTLHSVAAPAQAPYRAPSLVLQPALGIMTGAPDQYDRHELRAITVVRQLLSQQPELSLDALLEHVSLGPGTLLALLARLELAGQLEVTPSGRYRRRLGT